MNKKWKLGTWFGTDVFIHWTFVALLAWVLLFGGGLASGFFLAAIFACVVAHEYGHVLMARHYGIGTRDITLYPIGGVAALQAMPKRPAEEIAVALAGPLVNIVIAFVLAIVLLLTGQLTGNFTGLGGFFTTVMLANLFLAAFNLLPAFPMDGGRVLRAWLARKKDYVVATDIAAKVGRGFAVVFALLAIVYTAPMFFVLAAFVYLAAGAERRHAILERQASSSPLGWAFPDNPRTTAHPWGGGPVIDVEVIVPPRPR